MCEIKELSTVIFLFPYIAMKRGPVCVIQQEGNRRPHAVSSQAAPETDYWGSAGQSGGEQASVKSVYLLPSLGNEQTQRKSSSVYILSTYLSFAFKLSFIFC